MPWEVGGSSPSSLSLEWMFHPLFPQAEIFQMCSLERVRCWDHLDDVHDWNKLRLLYKFVRFWCVCVQVYLSCSCLRQASFVSSLVHETCRLPSWTGLMLSSVSSCPCVWGPVSDFTRKLPRFWTNNVIVIVKFYIQTVNWWYVEVQWTFIYWPCILPPC